MADSSKERFSPSGDWEVFVSELEALAQQSRGVVALRWKVFYSTVKVSKKRRQLPPNALDRMEVYAKVCTLFLQGRTADQIADLIKEECPGYDIGRQGVFPILRDAANHGQFKYIAPPSIRLRDKLGDRFPQLSRRLEVVHSVERIQIAEAAAEKILLMIAETGSRSDEFHLGFAGGGLLELTAALLSDKLREYRNPLPRTLYFHSLIARFDDDPTTDPNSFVRHFTSGDLPINVKFVGLMAPGFVSTETVMQLRLTEGIRDAIEKVAYLDLLVTSAGGHWTKGCSSLHEMYSGEHSELLEELGGQRCVGDLMWCPIGEAGPISLGHGKRAMTLVDLIELPTMIANGKRVMLVLGLCASCSRPKSDILRVLLKLRQPLLTDLIVDSYTVRTLLADLDASDADI